MYMLISLLILRSGVLNKTLPYMVKVVLTYIPIKCRIVDPNVGSFIVLGRQWSSLPMMLKFSGVVL